MYKQLIRPVLFKLNAETAHNLTLRALGLMRHIPFMERLLRWRYKRKTPLLARDVFGINFPNPVGLAAGLDKNAAYYNPLSDFGFGFIEVGSLTPLPQSGNPRPRIFRIPKDRAIINRMGINNEGVTAAIQRLKTDRPRVIISGNISRNSTSTGEQIAKDYDKAFSLLYDYVDMFTVNVSCPNVEGLSTLQDISFLSDVMDPILDRRAGMEVYKPVLVKISPDITEDQLDEILVYSMSNGVDGLVVGNTTRSRNGLTVRKRRIDSIGNGGMSGAPLFPKSIEKVRYIHEKTGGRLPIVGVGGIVSPAMAQEMLSAGASLVEVYTGFIYEGPSFVKKILQHLESRS